MALSMGYFFCILTAIMALRPMREAMGLARGDREEIRWLFQGTLVATLIATFAFGWLVARFRRRTFMAVSHGVMCAGLLVAWLLLESSPDQAGKTVGAVYYIFHSVLNLLLVSLFWALMADCFSIEQSKRLFPPIAVGGTLGALAGPAVVAFITDKTSLPIRHLLLFAIGMLALATVLAAFATRSADRRAPRDAQDRAGAEQRIIGGSIWASVVAVARSPYLLAIAIFPAVVSIISTFLYFTELRLVDESTASAVAAAIDAGATPEEADQTAQSLNANAFARINFLKQTATLAAQLFVAAGVMRLFGVGVCLALYPLAATIGIFALAAEPALGLYIGVASVLQAARYGFLKPAMATLFTVVTPAERFKAKAFIDTFVYRAGDAGAAQAEGAIEKTSGLWGLAQAVLPLAVVTSGVAFWLAHAQSRRARATQTASQAQTPHAGTTPPPAV